MTFPRGALIAGLAAAALANPAAAAPTPRQAQRALAHVRQLQQGHGVRTGYDLSPALARLYASLPSLSGSDRLQAESILARPDDNGPDPAGTHKWSGPEAGGSPVCGAHFCVHWTAAGADSSNQTYAQQMLDVLEAQVYPCENGTAANGCPNGPGLGWRDPAPDGGLGGSDNVDVYIEDLYDTEHVYGYTALDPNQPQDPSVPHHAYLVMDNNYSRYGGAGALANEQVTAAHEYNHVLQNAYDFLEDGWMFEATAVYMEKKVFPDTTDYVNYVKSWVANTKQPLTAFATTNTKAYGSAVWNHWLDHRYGPNVVRDAWADSVGAVNFAPSAYSASVAGAGGGGFSDEFDRFAAGVAEWNAPGAGFPDHYPDVPRDGTLPAGSQTAPFSLPHTTFAFFDVPIPADSPPTIRLVGTLPPGTAGAVALVGRTGNDPNAGTVTTSLTPMPTGGTAAVYLDNPAQFGRVTGVVVNADPSQSGYDQQADDYVYTRDASGVTATLAEPGVPLPTTGGSGTVADHAAVVNGTVDPHLIDTSWTIQYGLTAGYGSQTGPQPLAGTTIGAAEVAHVLPSLRANTVYHYRVVAINSAGAAAGQDMTFRTASDVTPPKLTLKVKRQPLHAVRSRGLLYLARCDEHCFGSAQLVRLGAAERKLGLPALLGKARVSLAARPTSSTLRVRLGRRATKLLAHYGRALRVSFRVTVRDGSGNSTTVKRTLRLSR